ncbi:MAG: iron complex outermembrane receptor protein [Candidatus Azotimanducaceae bacterium]|jgi:iron complex outermembrane receptor protein
MTKLTTRSLIAKSGVIAMTCLMAAPAFSAQDIMEEIVVTAQKREENIQEVPISITRMAGDRLTARFDGGEDILALASAAPGLHVESSNGRLAPRFYMRGLGNADFTQAASQPVSIVFDDVPMEKAALKSFPLFDMDDIEILRGPQGTLFGRNTTAGIIKVDSRRPTDETEGHIKGSVGDYGMLNLEAALGGSLVENTLSGRISFMHQNRDDWIDNGFTGENDAIGGFDVKAVRAQLLWTPIDNLTVWFMHQRQDQDGNSASAFRANVFSTGSNNLNANYDRDTVFFDGGDNNPAAIKSNGTTLKVAWDIGAYTLTSITSYQDVYDRAARGDIDGGFGCLFTCGGTPSGPPSIPFSPFASPFVVNVDTGSDIELNQFTQELRLASNFGGDFNYQVGVFYFDDEFNGDSQNQSAGATSYVTASTSTIENTSWAFFGQASYDLNEKLRLTGGIRYTDDEKDADHVRFTATGPVALAPISLDDDNVSWDLSLAYQLSDAANVYARAASGFRAPTVQDRLEDDPTVTTADSETIMSYEIGYKALLEKTRYSVAAFHYVVDDMQLTAVGGATNSTRLLNADEGIGYGIEFEMDYLLTDNLVISGGYGYSKTEINESGLATAPCGSGLCTVTDPINANGFAIIDGNPFQHAPEWTLNIEINYIRPLPSGNELYFFTDWKWKGETNDFLYESIEYTTDTQFEGGVKLGYRNLENDWEVGLFGRNITDEHNAIGGIDFANLTGYVNQPRIWGAQASYRF